MEKFIHNLSEEGFQEPQDISIEFVKGIDKKNINYINWGDFDENIIEVWNNTQG